MAQNMYWFWDAAADYHGTTVSYESWANPQKITPGFIKKNPEFAQWTRASVLPKAVVQAQKRK